MSRTPIVGFVIALFACSACDWTTFGHEHVDRDADADLDADLDAADAE